MSLLIGAVLSFVFLEWPWRFLVLIPLAVVEVAEILLWLKLRKQAPMTGRDALPGAHGRAVSDCAPLGQVRVKGQLWSAHAAEGVLAGQDVTVIRVDGLRLEVVAR